LLTFTPIIQKGKMKLKIGLLGVGHLGKIHLKCIQASEALTLVGFYDPDPVLAQKVAESFNTQAFPSYSALLEAIDAIDIVTPTTTHFELAKQAAEQGKHIFIEKPLTHTVAEAGDLIEIVKQNNVKVQIGHVERFNPAFLSLGDTNISPMFIEAHRLATFNPRGTDVSVVLDLMIHDIDLILHLVQSEIKSIHASGVSIVSASPDIANARIEFENGCVANLTASRMSLKQMRKVRFFQPDAYISLDFLEKNAQIIRLLSQDDKNTEGVDFSSLMPLETAKGTKWIDIKMPEPMQINAIQMELETFAESILHNRDTRVTIEDGYKALKVAHQIIEEIGDSTAS
jgi:predicted dehydrogenase